MDHCLSIKKSLDAKQPYNVIAKKVFLTYPTYVFVGNEDVQFSIFNEISEKFGIPISGIQVVGSAKTGKSFVKKKDFIPSQSDLDVAIVDSGLFIDYSSKVLKITNGYSDLSGFSFDKSGKSVHRSYIHYFSKGMIRPDLMPSGSVRADWMRFFSKLSNKHSKFFKSINAAIYLSETFFEYKQRKAIQDFVGNKIL